MRSAAKRQKVAHRNRRVAELEARVGEWQLNTLRERAELLNTSFEPIFLWTFPSREIAFWNAGAQELYGFAKAEALGRSVPELLQTQYPAPIDKIDEELQETHRWSGEVTHVSKNGCGIAVQSRLLLVEGAAGPMVFEANRDLTGERHAEKSLRLAAAVGSRSRALAAKAELNWRKLAGVIENVAQAIAVLDAHGQIIAANPAFARLHDVCALEKMPLSARALRELAEVRDADGEEISFSERPSQLALEGKIVLDRELNIINRSTGRHWVGLVSAAPIRNELGRVAQVVLSIHDLTERKQMENSLRHANADLEQFAYAAAHDLQEPARTVGLYSQLLNQQCGALLDKEAKGLLEGMIQGAKRMQDLIRDLLAYTRAIEAHSEDEIGTDVNEALGEVLENLRSAIQKSDAKIEYTTMPRVAARKTHVIQIFQNVLTNALKYGGRPPVVSASAEPLGHNYLFTVQDNGTGIPPEYHERIFKVFTRLHGKQIPGTGIGLAICERIINHYGGRIWVKSQAGQGSAFQFILPGLHEESCQTKSAS